MLPFMSAVNTLNPGHTGEFLHFMPQLPVLLLKFEDAHHSVQIDAFRPD